MTTEPMTTPTEPITSPSALDAAPARPLWQVILIRPVMMTVILLILEPIVAEHGCVDKARHRRFGDNDRFGFAPNLEPDRINLAGHLARVV